MTILKPGDGAGHKTITFGAPMAEAVKSTEYQSPGFKPPRRPAHDPVLSERVSTLADIDVEAAGPLQPVSFVPELLREAGDDFALEHGLIRPEPAGNIIRTAAPERLVSDVLHFYEDPDILKRVLPSEPRLAFALRMQIISWFAHSVFRLAGRPYLEGVSLARHWERLPKPGQTIFPKHFPAALNGLAQRSPDGEIVLDRPGAGRLLHVLAHALLLDAELVKFLTTARTK